MNEPKKRFPGKYIVYGLIAFVTLFMITGFVLAYRLTPVAERWRESDHPSQKK